jgi:hypothetical protein
MLEERVAALERRVVKLEFKIDHIEEALRRIELALRELAADNKDFRIVGIEGRLSQIPTGWQTKAILATLLVGMSGVLFTASRLVHP